MIYRLSLNFELDVFYFKDPVFLKVCERGGGGVLFLLEERLRFLSTFIDKDLADSDKSNTAFCML